MEIIEEDEREKMEGERENILHLVGNLSFNETTGCRYEYTVIV
jgi:hypothetical protein